MNYKEAVAKAEGIDKKLRSNSNFKNVVYMEHNDKTKMELWFADNIVEEDEWVMIFTEHHGFFVYHQEDLGSYYSVPMMEADKSVRMVEMEFDIEPEVVDTVIKIALEAIKDDKQALFEYGANIALKKVVETDGKCLKGEGEKEDE